MTSRSRGAWRGAVAAWGGFDISRITMLASMVSIGVLPAASIARTVHGKARIMH